MMMGSVMMKNTCTGDVPSRHLRSMSAVQVPTDRRDLHHPHAVQAPERLSMLQVIFISARNAPPPADSPACPTRHDKRDGDGKSRSDLEQRRKS